MATKVSATPAANAPIRVVKVLHAPSSGKAAALYEHVLPPTGQQWPLGNGPD